jgi:mannose-6-phosphate isomerase-like protein (cupin superfamily)
MKGYHTNIEQETADNQDFRRVLYTGDYTQLVLMSLEPSQSIGLETHGNDQFFRFESGSGTVEIDGEEYSVRDGDCVIVPAGAKHNVTNASTVDALKLYTLYSPPHHMDGTVHKTKSEADASHEAFDGTATE